ncbi:MAG: cupin domain-containing protein [candidate division Zixibacteria bacterium]|nr:cupin domain-containing protein [candidate division Zixibacteria bacterium]
MKDMVDYSEGSIVSRIIEKTPEGNITIFSFDTGEELSEHTTPYNAYVEILEGAASIVIGGKEVIAKEGELVLMPANVPHALYAKERFKMLLIMLKSKGEK